jgi:hypothetical protein
MVEPRLRHVDRPAVTGAAHRVTGLHAADPRQSWTPGSRGISIE